MKFIGQYIQDFIARFRSDVYLEGISTGTIASGSNLGLDSNNKIVKASEVGAVVDLTSEVTGVLASANMDGDTAHLSTDQTFSGRKTFTEVVTINGGISIDSNSITGVDDSAEFTDDDVHIMTSAAINDRFAQINANTTGSAATLTTARAINGVDFDGSVPITITAAGSTLSDTVTVAKGGTGATTLTSNAVLTGNGTSAIQAESTLSYTSETLTVGADDNGEAIITRLAHSDEAGGSLSVKGGDAGGSTKLGGHLNLYGGASRGAPAGGSIKFFSTPGGTETGSNLGTHVEIAALNSAGNLQIDGGLTVGSTSFVNSSGVIQVAGQTNITGIGTITTGVWNGTTIATANTAAKVTSVIAGDGIDVDSTTGDVTVTAETASATNPGIVELATTAEADSGTDTARAITAAGLKSHVDARFSYQNISFTGQATVPSDGDWITVSANGISNHTWNTNLGSGGTSVGSTTVTIPTGQICQGIIVPYDCVLVGFASLIRSVGNHQSKVGLAVGVPTYNDFATFDCTLRAYNAADISAGPDSNYSQRPTRADFLTANYAMSAGHVIFPLIGSVASNSRSVQWNCTLVLKTLIP